MMARCKCCQKFVSCVATIMDGTWAWLCEPCVFIVATIAINSGTSAMASYLRSTRDANEQKEIELLEYWASFESERDR